MRTNRTPPRGRALGDNLALLGTLACYWLTIFPLARRELQHWRTRAAAIPEPALRRIACTSVTDEGLNAEGAALFAMLAPLRRRRETTRLLVRFQILYDYLDALTEPPTPNPLRSSRRLHTALIAALCGSPPAGDYFAHHPLPGDDGYLAELAAACWASFSRLPSACTAQRLAVQSAMRSAEAQSQSHAAAFSDEHDLPRWAASATPPGSNLRWWEVAAAAESSLLIHALLASAAQTHLSTGDVTRIGAAYWPWITGLNALLDDLIDSAEDAAEGTHSFVLHYESSADAAERLGALAAGASSGIREVPLRRRHTVLLAAMTSYYLAAPEAEADAIEPVARRVREELGVNLRLLLAMLRLRRKIALRSSRQEAPASPPAV